MTGALVMGQFLTLMDSDRHSMYSSSGSMQQSGTWLIPLAIAYLSADGSGLR